MSLRQVIKKISADLENEGDGAVVRKSITKKKMVCLTFKFHIDLMGFTMSYWTRCITSRIFRFTSRWIQRPSSQRVFNLMEIYHAFNDMQGGIIYQDFNGHKITIHEGMFRDSKSRRDGVEVKVIAGESMGVQSLSYTKVPIMSLTLLSSQELKLTRPFQSHGPPLP
ncbi:hypothetical protein HID58_028193, partial [Brassica napus]